MFKIVDLKLNAILSAGSERAMEFLDRLGDRAKENLFNFEKMSDLMNDSLRAVRNVSLGALAAFTGLALTSPSVQAALARMKPALFEISETLGQALKPGLEVVGGILKDVAGWLQENTWFTDTLGAAFTTLSGIAETLWDKLKKVADLVIKPVFEWAAEIKLGEKLQWLFDTFGYTILGAIFGFIVGTPFGVGLQAAGVFALAGLAADITSGISNMFNDQTNTGAGSGGGGAGSGTIVLNNIINGELISSDEYEVNLG